MKKKSAFNRQLLLLTMRFGVIVIAIAVNIAFVMEPSMTTRVVVMILSGLAIVAFYLLINSVLEPLRLRFIVRKSGEALIIAPHNGWYVQRESRSDWSHVFGVMALTERTLHYQSSPLNIYADIVCAIDLHFINKLHPSDKEDKPGHYLVLTLSDGAVMRLRLATKPEQTKWLKELEFRIGKQAEAAAK